MVELRRHLANLGVKTAENWEEHPETLFIFDDTLLSSLWPHVDVKQVLKPIFKEMTWIITEIRKIPPVELSVQSPPKDRFDKPSFEETERLIRRGVAALLVWKPQLGRALDSLLLEASTFAAEKENALALVRTNIEQWFDEAMERASGWYKRSTQLWLGVVGLLLACILNVDTLTVATALWRDPTLRQNVVEHAQRYQLPSTGDETSIKSAAEAAQAIRDLNLALSRDLQLPIGWQTEFYQLKANEACVWVLQRPGDIWGISTKDGCLQLKEPLPNQSAGPLAKLLGLLLTAVAVSQGAPFWFDLLSKLANVRSSGAVPATSDQKAKEKVNQQVRRETARASS